MYSQAYRSIRTGKKTNSLRRFFWYEDIKDPKSVIQLLLKRMTFGDVCSSVILTECTDLIAKDPDISLETKDFLENSWYVDDGGISSQFIEKLERICRELRPLMDKYGLQTYPQKL